VKKLWPQSLTHLVLMRKSLYNETIRKQRRNGEMMPNMQKRNLAVLMAKTKSVKIKK